MTVPPTRAWRLADVVRPLLVGGRFAGHALPADLGPGSRPEAGGLVLDVSPGGELEPLLALPADVDYARWMPDGGEPPGREPHRTAVVVAAVGSEAELDDVLDVVARVLTAPGASASWALLVSRWSAADLPRMAIETGLAARDLELIAASPLAYQRHPVALLVGGVRRADRAEPPVAPGPRAPGEPFTTLEDIERRELRARVVALEAQLSRAPAPGRSSLPAEDTGRRTAELSQTLRRAEDRLRAAERRIASLERSAGFRVGSALVRTARHPLRGARRLPGEMLAVWRGRRAPGPTEPVGEPLALTEERRFLAHSAAAFGPRDRLVVVGALREETAHALGSVALVTATTPNDAALAVERVDPDVVIIETAAGAPGSAWAYLGDPAAIERERRALDVLDAARAAGRPVVLWRNSPVHQTATLDEFAARCDLVVDGETALVRSSAWSRGVALVDHVPLGPGPRSDPRSDPGSGRSDPRSDPGSGRSGLRSGLRSGAVHLAGWDNRLPPGPRALLAATLAAVAELGPELRIFPDASALDRDAGLPEELRPMLAEPLGWRRRPAVAASASLAVADPFSVAPGVNGLAPRALELLAAGTRVLVGPNADLLTGYGDVLCAVAPGEDPKRIVAEALARGAPDPAEYWALLRRLFLEHSVPVALADLVGRLGLDSDPAAGRRYGIVAELDDDADRDRLVSAVAAARLRPAVVQVRTPDDTPIPDVLRGELEALGPVVEVAPRHPDRPELSLPVVPWLLTWPARDGVGVGGAGLGEPDATLALDLLIAAECADAQAAGLVPGDGLDLLPADAAVTGPLLVRREVLARGGGPRIGPGEVRTCGLGTGRRP